MNSMNFLKKKSLLDWLGHRGDVRVEQGKVVNLLINSQEPLQHF